MPAITRATRSTTSKVSPATKFLRVDELDPDTSINSSDEEFSFDEDDATHSDEDEDAVIGEDEFRKPIVVKAFGLNIKMPAPFLANPEEEAYFIMRSAQIEEDYQKALQLAEVRRKAEESREVINSDEEEDEEDFAGQGPSSKSNASTKSRSRSPPVAGKLNKKAGLPKSDEEALTKKVDELNLVA